MTRAVRVIRLPDDSPDADELAFLCLVCQETARIAAAEPFAPQVRLFLDQHSHDEPANATEVE